METWNNCIPLLKSLAINNQSNDTPVLTVNSSVTQRKQNKTDYVELTYLLYRLPKHLLH